MVSSPNLFNLSCNKLFYQSAVIHAKFSLQFFTILLVRGYEIFKACDRHSVETLSKHVAEYKYVYAEIDGLISQQLSGSSL